jgi:TP901 family phage tail tape measure protein
LAGIKFEAEGYGEFKKSLNEIKSSLKVVSSELKATKSEFDKNDSSVTALTTKNKALSKTIEEQKKYVDQLAKGVAAATEEFGENDKRTQDLTIEYNRAQTQLNKLEREYQNNEKAIQDYGKAQIKAAKDSEEFQRAQEKLKSAFEAVKAAAIAGAAAIGTALVGSAKAAIDFEDAFAGVIKTVDATDEQLAKLSDGIREMAKDIPVAANEIAGIAESAGQLGIETDNILGFTRVIADLGVATNLTGEQAASSLAKFANITQMPQENFDRLGSTIVALGNNLATTEADIVSMGQRLAGAGSQVGMTEAQIMSFAGALSSVGIEAEAGGSAFSKVMIEMQLAAETGSGKLKDFASVAGMSAEQFAKAYREDAASALIAFIDGLSASEEKGISAIKVLDDMGISEVRMRDALLRAAGASDVFTEAVELGTKAWEENTALANEAEVRYGTVKSQLQILKNTFVDVAMQIGEQLLPVIREFIEKLKNIDTKPITDAFSWLLQNGSMIVSVIAGIAAGMVAWNVVTTVQAVIGAVKAWKIATDGMAVSQQLLNVIMAANPIGIIITAIAALVAGIIVLWNTNEDFRNKITEIWEAIKNVFITAWEAITELWSGAGEFFSSVWEGIKTAFASVKEWFSEKFNAAWEAIKAIWEPVGNYFSAVWETIKGVFAVVEAVLSGDFQGAWDAIKGIVDVWADYFGNAWKDIKNVFNDAKEWGKKMITAVWDGMKVAWESVTSWFNNVWDSLFGNRTANVTVNKKVIGTDGSHASGLNYVPFDGYIAELHRGEMVVPASLANDLRNIGVTAKKQTDIASLMSSSVNAINMQGGGNQHITVEIPISINGREFYRASINDLWAVMSSNPRVVSDAI